MQCAHYRVAPHHLGSSPKDRRSYDLNLSFAVIHEAMKPHCLRSSERPRAMMVGQTRTFSPEAKTSPGCTATPSPVIRTRRNSVWSPSVRDRSKILKHPRESASSTKKETWIARSVGGSNLEMHRSRGDHPPRGGLLPKNSIEREYERNVILTEVDVKAMMRIRERFDEVLRELRRKCRERGVQRRLHPKRDAGKNIAIDSNLACAACLIQ